MSEICGNCQKEIDDLAFCPFCGLAQRCTNCETAYIKDEKFCGNCGEKRPGPSTQNKQKSVETEGQSAEQRPRMITLPKKGLNPIVIGIAALIVIAFFFFFKDSFTNPEAKVEETITSYLTAIGELNFNEARNFHHPHSPYIDDSSDFDEVPFDLKLKIHGISDIELYEDYAEAAALVTISSVYEDEKFTNELYFELEKFNGKWFIYDMY